MGRRGDRRQPETRCHVGDAAAHADQVLARLGHGRAHLGADLDLGTQELMADAVAQFLDADPGMVGGLVVAVPTSTGYGVAQGGHTALHSALASCAPGLVAVNIDNGYGAACAAIRALGLHTRPGSKAPQR
jgi:hypothetical protein